MKIILAVHYWMYAKSQSVCINGKIDSHLFCNALSDRDSKQDLEGYNLLLFFLSVGHNHFYLYSWNCYNHLSIALREKIYISYLCNFWFAHLHVHYTLWPICSHENSIHTNLMVKWAPQRIIREARNEGYKLDSPGHWITKVSWLGIHFSSIIDLFSMKG